MPNRGDPVRVRGRGDHGSVRSIAAAGPARSNDGSAQEMSIAAVAGFFSLRRPKVTVTVKATQARSGAT